MHQNKNKHKFLALCPPGAMRNSVLVDLKRKKASSLTGSRSLTTDLAWLVMPFTKPAIFDVVVLSRLLLVTAPCTHIATIA